jgi:hypothetical protein
MKVGDVLKTLDFTKEAEKRMEALYSDERNILVFEHILLDAIGSKIPNATAKEIKSLFLHLRNFKSSGT